MQTAKFSLPEDLTTAYQQLRKAAETHPDDHAAQLLALAKRAAKSGQRALSRQVFCSAAHAFSSAGRFPKATHALACCISSARRDRDRADLARAQLVRATLQQAQGDLKASLVTALDLVCGEKLLDMAPGLRYFALSLAVEQCALVDPAAALTLHETVSRRLMDHGPHDLPWHFRCAAAGLYIDCLLWSMSAFQDMLRPMPFVLDRNPDQLLRRVEQLLHLDPTQDEAAVTPLVQEVIKVQVALMQALRSNDYRPAAALTQAWRDLGVNNPVFRLKSGYQCAATLLVLGRADLAAAFIATCKKSIARSRLAPEVQLPWLHLEAAVSEGLNSAHSGQKYKRYASAALQFHSQMGVDVPSLLKKALPTAPVQPSSTQDPAPAYVRKALKCMEQHLEQPITIREIAAQVGVSERTLREAFQSYLGVSPKQHLTALRLEAARRWDEEHRGERMDLRAMAARFRIGSGKRLRAALD